MCVHVANFQTDPVLCALNECTGTNVRPLHIMFEGTIEPFDVANIQYSIMKLTEDMPTMSAHMNDVNEMAAEAPGWALYAITIDEYMSTHPHGIPIGSIPHPRRPRRSIQEFAYFDEQMTSIFALEGVPLVDHPTRRVWAICMYLRSIFKISEPEFESYFDADALIELARTLKAMFRAPEFRVPRRNGLKSSSKGSLTLPCGRIGTNASSQELNILLSDKFLYTGNVLCPS